LRVHSAGEMDLKAAFESGMTVDAYVSLLEEGRDVHALHARRAILPDDALAVIRDAGPHRVLVITEPWCGDSLVVFPVVERLFREAGDSELRVVRRDEHLALMDRYLTRGGRAIPVVILLDAAFGERGHWGPRPAPAQAIFEANREALEQGRVDRREVSKKMRAFFGADRGETIVREMAALLVEDTAGPR